MRLSSDHRPRTGLSALVTAAVMLLGAALPASADTFGLGTAENYAILSYSGSTVSLAGGSVANPITGLTGTYVVGNVAIGDGGKYSQSAGTVNGTVFLGTNATINISGVNNSVINNGQPVSGGGGSLITGGIQQTSGTSAAITTALQTATNQSAYYAGVTSTCISSSTCSSYQTFGNISGNTTITGVSGLNVINVTGDITLNGQTLTLNGPADAFFVFNVAGNITFNGGTTQTINGQNVNVAVNLTGGVPALNVLFNQYGSGNKVSFTNNALAYGIFLNPNGGIGLGDPITLSGGEVIGELIGGNITLVSSSQVVNPTRVPETTTFFLLVPAIALVFGFRRRLFNQYN
jgi:hypothetical protein